MTYLGDGIFESLRARSSPSFTVVLGELRDASVDSAGSWSDALLPCRCSGGCECENDATVEQLDQVEGIGPVTAQKIIEFRDQHGGLSSVDQLDEVDGIGPATMRTLRSGLQP